MEITQRTSKLTVSQALASKGIQALQDDMHLTNDQKLKVASTSLTLASNPNLKGCDGASIVKYVLEVLRYNFSRPDCSFPVPYGNSIQMQISYKGFRELALQSGAYYDVGATKVYDCDHIKRDRMTGRIEVEFEEDYTKTINAKVVGYYAYALDKETKEVCNSVFWTKEQCEHHGKTYSKTYSSLWGKNDYSFDKMALKTVIKQLTGELKTTPQLEQARKQDGYVYGEGYADNPQSKNKVVSEIDEVFDKALDEDTGEIVENEPDPIDEQSPEMLATADLREQLANKNH